MSKSCSVLFGFIAAVCFSLNSYAADTKKFSELCPQAALTFQDDNVQRNAVLVFDVPHRQLYWKTVGQPALSPVNDLKDPLASRISGAVFVAVCALDADQDASLDQKSVLVSGPSGEMAMVELHPDEKHDKLFVLDAVADNAVTTVQLTVINSEKKPVTSITALLERHKKVYFAASGGLLLTRATATAYSVSGVPTTLTTKTDTVVTTTTAGVTTATTTTSTTATSLGSASYVFGTRGDRVQTNAIGGLTFYPFGHDAFPINGRAFTSTYAFKHKQQALGIFLGTSLNTLGNFTTALSFEIFPGVQPFVGSTWWKKDELKAGLTPCSGFGTSPSYDVPPATTTTVAASSAGPPATTMTTITTVRTSAVSGCVNGNLASMVSGTVAPINSTLKPAFSFGLLFNTNLLGAFSALKK